MCFLEEYLAFKKFGDSLLTRANKVTDLHNTVDGYSDSVGENSTDAKKLAKPCP